MGTRIGGFIGVSTSTTDLSASGIWDYDSQSYFKRQGQAFWPGGESFGPIAATGGTITTPGNGYKYHFFTASGPFHVVRGIGNVEVFLVAGGGAGTFTPGGGAGGGAGGMRTIPSVHVNVQNYTVQCGAGGAGSTQQTQTGFSGNPSKITDTEGTILCQSTGGGYGSPPGSAPSDHDVNGYTGGVGGSGGGGDYGGTAVAAAGNAGGYSPPEGNPGGAGNGGGPRYGGGGGGGAGGAGGGPTSGGGTGGSGSYFNDPIINGLPQYGTPGPDGSYRYFAGGGGGGAYGHPGSSGALANAPVSGGGGRGMPNPGVTPISPGPLKNGQANTGGGGGGHGFHPSAGTLQPTDTAGNGGSGFVCIRYPV